ncbi:YALI0F10032p [Yarrowia lipolytica CLIB122]|uniref:YALI0F10032p n=2 Tax=Yarrowia lipolytica TaxID=4952 RepID=Q6C281_YARLI|nr:YALI0F10032p [Yarrowia lipolytica CLIB122]AOW06933.1 hypothetical protein YALI1_F13579g [Yarrowia lipolytica]KAB8284014.1 ribosomal protein L6, alpha-beta domain-containing protein [Yarrowia lipolytica]KAE8173601.1 ribosomal protein L6, alpha-beta domain-containing protein [Yarrowia lipolytica]KAJ8055887.1 ribosomal protein L6, alpha-beta domain-containing protein [Yarrowia lipolytica]RMI97832.1 ribosomal protein L6, alpha-beta domain-containing protein [Yarrowia lipolytica]|eukprot:XP_505231.1 YALI0F10032p [Yarrowia lipolytica CLIB122]
MLRTRAFSTSARVLSYIGKQPILVPESVTLQISPTEVVVEGPLGRVQMSKPTFVNIASSQDTMSSGSVLSVSVNDATNKTQRAMWGTMRGLINNHVTGVTDGHVALLTLVGTGYRAGVEKDAHTGAPIVSVRCGFSHPINFVIPAGIEVTTPIPTRILIKGADKQQVKLFGASIRLKRPPEPYKGKGIYLDDETITRKATKVK